jgi:hypothetical protein
MPNTLSENDWYLLLKRIKVGKCTPFLGAGACYGALPLGSDVGREWAQEYDYPLEDLDDLARVAQFLAVEYDPMFPKEELLNRFRAGATPDFTDPNEPHRVLADLPLPVYLTTNYDDFMMQALKSRNRDPKRAVCRWNNRLKTQSKPVFNPTVANPVVFHLHGHNELVESLVLTEDDYLDFLVNTSKDPDLLPPRVQAAMTTASLLFLGYRIADWDFRVIFRSVVRYLEISTQRVHISVQLVPGADTISEAQKEKAQKYLDRYFGELKIRVYWGTCREFAAELRSRWETFDHDS